MAEKKLSRNFFDTDADDRYRMTGLGQRRRRQQPQGRSGSFVAADERGRRDASRIESRGPSSLSSSLSRGRSAAPRSHRTRCFFLRAYVRRRCSASRRCCCCMEVALTEEQNFKEGIFNMRERVKVCVRVRMCACVSKREREGEEC